MSNLTIKIWLKERYPHLLKEFDELMKNRKREQQRKRAAEIYKLAKSVLKNTGQE